MAGDKVNNYSQVDSNILELQLTTDKTFKGYHQLTLTNYDNTTVPAIAAGSAIECNGALYKFDSEEAISTTDPVTSAAVADGTVYVCIVPGATTCTAAFTATAPTWSDSKQGWYGTGGQANYRYAEYLAVKATASYSPKIPLSNKNTLKVGLTANQTVSTAGRTNVLFDSVIYDFNGLYTPVSGTVTIKEAGLYSISGFMIFENISNIVDVRYNKNGDTSLYTPFMGRVPPESAGATFYLLDYLSPTDYFNVTVSSGDSSYAVNIYSFLTVNKVA
jgi:hypothetical protein